jgi:hypothetical protein
MAHRWFYAHHGHTLGPVSARQLKYLAASGGLQPEDLIWTEGSDPAKAVAAERALDFGALRRLAQELGRRPAASKPQPADEELPGWLDEMDRLYRDPEQALGPVPDWLQPEPTTAVAGVPDWLSDLAGAAPPPDPPPPDIIEAAPVPIAPPVATPVGNALLERMGIDPVSERVVDWGKLKRWLEEQMRQRPGELPVPSEMDADPFQAARKQLAAWFDLPKNRDRLACGELSALREDAALRQFMNHFTRYGADKLARLWEFVDFLIDARLRNPGP